jgi:hypothetical protein
MLEKVIELLLGLAVAAAAAAGIGTATTTPHGVGPDADSIAAKVAWAEQHAADLRSAAADEVTLEEAAAVEAAGLDTALEALERVMSTAPDAASDGLQQAWNSVSTAGPPDDPGSAADVAPVDVPAGPPAETPAGPPEGVPPGDAGP